MYFEEKAVGVINSVSVILRSYYNLEKCHLSNIFYLSLGQQGHEINFMFRKINISKKKQFYQEIPIENMRYLNTRKENLNFHQKYST